MWYNLSIEKFDKKMALFSLALVLGAQGSAAPMTAWEKNQISPLERRHGGPRVCSGRILGLKISSNLDTVGRDSQSTLYILICNKENG